MNLPDLLRPYDLTVLDLVSYLGLAALGTMGTGLLLGLLLASKYDPVVSWPRRKLPLFKVHNILAYVTLVLIVAHPVLLLAAPEQGFSILSLAIPVFAPKQPLENTFGAIALYCTFVVVLTSYFRSRMSFRTWKLIHFANYVSAIAYILHSLLTNPNLNDKEIDYSDGGKVFVLISVVAIVLAVVGRAFYAGRAARSGTSTAHEVQASAARWEGRLRLARKFVETHAVKTFRLMTEDGRPLPFKWAPGQYITVALQTPNGPLRRAYTIASSPNQTRYLEITVKRELNGSGSNYLHDNVKEGDLLKITGPQGDFTFTGTEAEGILMIAGGVGITPMMSKLRHLTEVTWDGPVTLIYAVQRPQDTIFNTELRELQRRHPNVQVHVIPTEVGNTSWSGNSGLIDRDLLHELVPNIAHFRVHVCGPAPMMKAVISMLRSLDVSDDAIFTESFTALPTDDGPGATEEIAITFAKSGRTVLAHRGESIVRVAEANGISIDYSCRNGECGSCRCKLLEGEVKMPDKTALTAGDRDRGVILTCVARPLTDRISLDL